jgi:hypothetical protein
MFIIWIPHECPLSVELGTFLPATFAYWRSSPPTKMCGRILLLSSLLSRLAVGLLPIDPTITAPAVLPRQIDDRLIGYKSIGNNTCEHNLDIDARVITDLT